MQLKKNVAVFSAFKSHAQGYEIFQALTDPDGKRRSWNDFKKEAAAIDSKYNQQWLEAEYNLATRQARSAVQWSDFERDKDVYPNLEYMPSRAAEPSAEHTRYYGMIAAIDDPVWDTLMPPSRWNCQCWVRQTLATTTVTRPEPPAAIRGISGNAGKTGMVFSPSHPYIDNLTKPAKEEVRAQLNKLMENNSEMIRLKMGKNALMVAVNSDPGDLDVNVDFGSSIVKALKTDVQINPHYYTPGKKNPEFTLQGTIGDLYRFQGTNLRSAIASGFSSKVGKDGQMYKQKCWIGFDLNGKLSPEIADGFVAQLYGKMKHFENVKFIIVRNGAKLCKVENGKDISFPELLEQIKKELL